MKRILYIVAALAMIGYAGLAIRYAGKANDLHINQVKLHDTTRDLKQLQLDYQVTNTKLQQELQNNTVDQQKVEQLKADSDKQQQRIQELEAQLQARAKQKAEEKAKADELAARALNTVTLTRTASAQAATGGIDCKSQTTAKAFIYCHESGNNPAAVNAGGCRGLGQACPGSKLPCGSNDYACQDEWFTNYMLGRYGSWENAKAHWLARIPVGGRDVGNWW